MTIIENNSIRKRQGWVQKQRNMVDIVDKQKLHIRAVGSFPRVGWPLACDVRGCEVGDVK